MHFFKSACREVTATCGIIDKRAICILPKRENQNAPQPAIVICELKSRKNTRALSEDASAERSTRLNGDHRGPNSGRDRRGALRLALNEHVHKMPLGARTVLAFAKKADLVAHG
jgi:hypothetical protein